jgi:putative endonuclease
LSGAPAHGRPAFAGRDKIGVAFSICHGPAQSDRATQWARGRALETTCFGKTCAMANTYFVYILASGRNGTLYIGVTNDLVRRVWEHREGLVPGFTKRYDVKMLVYYEQFQNIGFAIHRETRLKKWKRQWKLELIESVNPDWSDLYEGLGF